MEFGILTVSCQSYVGLDARGGPADAAGADGHAAAFGAAGAGREGPAGPLKNLKNIRPAPSREDGAGRGFLFRRGKLCRSDSPLLQGHEGARGGHHLIGGADDPPGRG